MMKSKELVKTWFTGSRNLENSHEIEEIVRDFYYLSDEIWTGGARGVDTYVENYVKKFIGNGMKNYRDRFPLLKPSLKADWKKGKGAGMERNIEGVKWADRVVAIWNGTSKGTAHCISNAVAMEKLVHVYTFTVEVFGNTRIVTYSCPSKDSSRKRKVGQKIKKDAISSWKKRR